MEGESESGPPLPGLIVLFVGAAFITISAAFLSYGLYALIRTGAWPAYPASRMLSEIGITVRPGGQGPLAWLASQSACTVLLAIGTVIAAVGIWLIARHNRRVRPAAADAGPTA